MGRPVFYIEMVWHAAWQNWKEFRAGTMDFCEPPKWFSSPYRCSCGWRPGKPRAHILVPCDQTVQCSVCLVVDWGDTRLADECPGPADVTSDDKQGGKDGS